MLQTVYTNVEEERDCFQHDLTHESNFEGLI